MSYEDEHAERLESHEPHRQTIARLRDLLSRAHPSTTGPLASYSFLQLEEEARFPKNGASYGNAQAKAVVTMCIRAAGEYGGATPLAGAYFELAQGSGYRLEIASGMLQPAPTGRMASAIEEHFTPGRASRTTAKDWQRARFRFARLRDIVGGSPIELGGITAQLPSAASAPSSSSWRDCPSCGWRHYTRAPGWDLPNACDGCGDDLGA